MWIKHHFLLALIQFQSIQEDNGAFKQLPIESTFEIPNPFGSGKFFTITLICSIRIHHSGKFLYHKGTASRNLENFTKVTKNSSGVAIKAVVSYDAFEYYVWDADEDKFMGVAKLGTYVEEIDLVNGTSLGGQFLKD